MGNIVAWLIAKGISPKFARPLVYIGIAIALGLAFLALVKWHDANVIDEYTAEQRAETAESDRKADATAAVERRADDARAATEAEEIKEAITDAGPDSSDRRAAYYACVKLQQAARRDNKPPADC
jgi:hypothetical protein